MARNPNRDSDNYMFSSEENLEKQAELMERLADKVARNMERKFESVYQRLSESQQKELNQWDKTVQAAAKRWHEGQEGNGLSFKQNLAANILNQTGAGQKFDANWKSVGATIGKTILEGLGNIFSIYITKPIQQGFHDMSSAYETNFTEIAGCMGTNRDQTYNIMKDTVNSLSGSFKNAIDANNELIPELRKVSGQGFTGDKAISQALANAVDAKLMPWLDTASDTWANLSFNLSKTQMQQIKGQQLLLQETQSGNRLLQSGIINQLTNDIAPVLTNIDLNTGGAQNLAPEAQAHMVSLMDQGYSAQEAYAAVQENLKVWKDPTAGFDKGDYSSVMKAQAAYLGGDYSDIAVADAYGHRLAAGARNNAGFIQHGLGLDLATGIYRAEGSSQYLKGLYGTDWDSFKNKNADEVYQSLADRVAEKVTATQSHDNWWKNTTTQAAYGLNSWAHGPDVIETGFKTLIKIGESILGVLVGKSVLKWATGGLGGSTPMMSNAGSIPTFNGGGSSSHNGLIGLFNKAGVNASKNGSLEKFATAGSTGATVSGLVNTAGVAGGLAMGAYGITEGVKDFKEGETGTGVSNTVGGVLGLAGAGAIGASMLGVGAANIWNPVGWAALIAGGATLLGTAIYKSANSTSKTVEEANGVVDDTVEKIKELKANDRKTADSLIETLENAQKGSEEYKSAVERMTDLGLVDKDKAEQLGTQSLIDILENFKKISDKETWEATQKGKEIKAANKAWDKKVITGSDEKEGSLLNKFKDLEGGEKLSSNWFTRMFGGDTVDQISAGSDAGETWRKYNENQQAALTAALQDTTLSDDDREDIQKALSKLEKDYQKVWEDTNGFQENLDKSTISYNMVQRAFGNGSGVGKIVRTYGMSGDNAVQSWHDDLGISTEGYTSKEQAAEEVARSGNVDTEDGKSSYAVGTPYLYHDTVAQLHEGEAVLTKSENKARLAGLLGLDNKSRETSNLSATEIVNAITSQTNELKQAINEIINTITSNSKQTSFNPRINNSIEMMMPTIANTRNLGVR